MTWTGYIAPKGHPWQLRHARTGEVVSYHRTEYAARSVALRRQRQGIPLVVERVVAAVVLSPQRWLQRRKELME